MTQRSHLTVAEFCDEMLIARSTFYDWRAKRRARDCQENGVTRSCLVSYGQR